MLDLNGIVSVETIHELAEYTKLRFRNSFKYDCAEALGMYEQRILPNDDILRLCESKVGRDLYQPVTSYIPDDIVRHFHGSDVVPVSFSPMRGIVTCVYLLEVGDRYMPLQNYKVELLPTTIYYYFEKYIHHYGHHPDLQEVSERVLLDSIVREGILLGASDITLSSVGRSCAVYYNVRKKKVYSQRILADNNMDNIIKILCIESPMNYASNQPKYVGVNLNNQYRGRVVINTKYHGYAITVRLLPNAAFEGTLEKCNLTKETIKFLRRDFMNKELGLRVIVGSTMSGKNTTALCLLREACMNDNLKVVSVEMPVEQELVGVEQIQCDTDEEFAANTSSLLRQNPDFVYITEIGDSTATPIMHVTNTGKRVLSTLHANSVSDVIGRLQDITGMTTDRLIQSLHSIVYQELVRDNETDSVVPKNRFVYLSPDYKAKLYGKSYGEIITKIKEWECGDVW